MILGVGTDLVSVDRFIPWAGYAVERLHKIFTPDELAQSLRAESLAARFAAKEAFYKALSAMLVRIDLTQKTMGLRALCPLVGVVTHEWGVPTLIIDVRAIEKKLGVALPLFHTHLSLSHEKNMAIAMVIIESAV